jgi:hypothetical protein
MEIIVKKTLKYLKIYVDESLHLNIPIEEYSGIQSWIEGDNLCTYCIEFYLKNGQKILCTYEDKKIWMLILNKIDEVL